MATMTNVTCAQMLHEEQDPRRWFAVITTPQHEKAAFRHLDFGGIETFLPTYESSRVWKNRQKVTVELPLFPTYLFVRIDRGGAYEGTAHSRSSAAGRQQPRAA